MQKVIIDCDPGIDDTLALLYALASPELDVQAITVVCGNVPVEIGVENVFKCLEKVNRLDIPVYQGAASPLSRKKEEELSMNVKIFSKNNCIQCKMAKRFLSENNIAFEEINIDAQPDAIDWLKEQGFQSVPVITSEATTVVGFRPDQLKQLAS